MTDSDDDTMASKRPTAHVDDDTVAAKTAPASEAETPEAFTISELKELNKKKVTYEMTQK